MRSRTENQPTNKARRDLLTVAGLLVLGLGSGVNLANAEDELEPMFMFVHVSDDLEADLANRTLRLVNVNQQVLYFSDRPQRLAGHLKMADYLNEWTAAEGDDNFTADPPNATLSVYEPGQPDNTLAVVEISDPVVDGDDLIYTYTLLDGTMPAAGGATTLFIDRIGIGGGVGVGYHGVGVGLRGPGVL